MEIGQSIWISVENLACFYIAILLVINVLSWKYYICII